MSDLYLKSGRVIISRDIIVDGSTIGLLDHFELGGRWWVTVSMDPDWKGFGHEATALRLAMERFAEMKMLTVSTRIADDDSYMGRILHSLGFVVFRLGNRSVMLEKHLFPATPEVD